MYLDLDTGRFVEFKTAPDRVALRKAGVDVCIEPMAKQSASSLDTCGMQLRPLPKGGWGSAPAHVRQTLGLGESYPLMAKKSGAMAFGTGDGGMGILEVVAVSDKPQSVTLRYGLFGHVLAAGDIIDANIVKGELTSSLRGYVDPEGVLEVTVAGEKRRIKAGGITVDELASDLSKLLGGRAVVSVRQGLRPDDVIDISVMGLFADDLEVVLRRQIEKDGTIKLPLLEVRVTAAGESVESLAASVSKLYGGMKTTVTVPTVVKGPMSSLEAAALSTGTGPVARPGQGGSE